MEHSSNENMTQNPPIAYLKEILEKGVECQNQ